MRYLMLRKLLRQTLNWNSWTTVYWITYRCSKRQLHNLNQYLSRYSFVSLSYQCLNPDTILLAIGVNTDTSNQLINVSNRTGRDLVCYQLDNSDRMFQWNQITLNISVSTYVFEIYILQVKVNRRNYNFYVVIYITWLLQSC